MKNLVRTTYLKEKKIQFLILQIKPLMNRQSPILIPHMRGVPIGNYFYIDESKARIENVNDTTSRVFVPRRNFLKQFLHDIEEVIGRLHLMTLYEYPNKFNSMEAHCENERLYIQLRADMYYMKKGWSYLLSMGQR
jgi:hypothetical protein